MKIREMRECTPAQMQAVGLYTHTGFETYRRTDCNEEGGPYLRLK